MFESQTIKKIKSLETIKPRKEWVFSAKEEILGSGEEDNAFISWFPVMFSKPALVYTPILMVAIILTGFLVYSNYQVEELNHVVMEVETEKEINLASLESLKISLTEMELSLEKLKQRKDKKEALVMAEIVKSTAKEGERVVESLRNSDEEFSTEVLATLEGLDNQARGIETASIGLQKEILADYILFLEERSLTVEDQDRLERAKAFYEEGKEDQAMLLITKINNN